MAVLNISDFSIKTQMRINTVKRWHVVPTIKEQTVADHTCGVMLLGRAVIDFMNLVNCQELFAVFCEMALDHDIPEVLTGDTPSPVKKALGMDDVIVSNLYDEQGNDIANMAKQILKACDILESILWISKFGVESHQVYECHLSLEEYLKEYLESCDMAAADAVKFVWKQAASGDESFPQDLPRMLGNGA